MWFVKHKVWSQTDLYRQKDDAHCLFAFFFDCLISSYDCSNPIYGQTVNPHNFQKTSGGSSGGEGALIGGGGSLLGIGSDIGGSIRIPASFCGICGFKPTSGRLRWEFLFQSVLWMIIVHLWYSALHLNCEMFWFLCVLVSSQGNSPIYRGQKSGKLQLYHLHHEYCMCRQKPWSLFCVFLLKLVLSSSGPMARDVDSLALCMQALLCDHMFSLDPTVPPIPFNTQVCPVEKKQNN